MEFLRIGADFLFLEFLQTYEKKSSASLLGICVSTQRRAFGVSAYMRRCSFLEFLQTYAKKLRVSNRNLRMNANGKLLEFLRICAYFLVLEFLQTCAKATTNAVDI